MCLMQVVGAQYTGQQVLEQVLDLWCVLTICWPPTQHRVLTRVFKVHHSSSCRCCSSCCCTTCAGDVWHVSVQGLPGSGVCYALRVSGEGGWSTGYRWDSSRLLLDPRAPLVAGRSSWGKREALEDFQQTVSEGG